MVRVFVSNIQSGERGGGKGGPATQKANAPSGSGRWFNLLPGASVSTFGRRRGRDFIDNPRRIIRPDHASDWENDRECRTLTEPALREDMAAQCVDQLPGDAETQTSATELARPRLIDLPEILPD